MSSSPAENAHNDPAIINIRKLVALDIIFHGSKFILAEFAFGVFASAALGFVILYLGLAVMHVSDPRQCLIVGCYILSLGINYVPLLLYAIQIARQGSAQEEVAFELTQKARYGRKYTAQSLLVLLPLVVPVLAIAQEWRKQARR